MDVDSIFAEGQLYTGLSRVETLDNLRLMGTLCFDVKCCHEKVRTFELETVWTTVLNGPDDEQVVLEGVADEDVLRGQNSEHVSNVAFEVAKQAKVS